MLERWREADVFDRQLATSAARPAPRSGASTRGRRRRTARPAPTTCSRGCSRTSIRATGRCAATTCRARRAGTATGCRSSSRSRRSSGSRRRRRSRSTGSPSSTPRCRESVFRYVEDWNRLTERIGFWIDLDDPYVTLDNDYIESVWWALRQIWDDGPPLQGATRSSPTARARHGALLARGRAGLRGRRGPLGLRAAAGGRGAARRRDPREPDRARRPAARLDHDPWTLISNAALAVGAEIEYVARPSSTTRSRARRATLVERVLGEDAEVLAHFPGLGARGHPLRAAVPLHQPTTGRAATRCCSATSSRTDGRHRHRPHGDRLRRGRLPARRASTGSRCRTRSAPTARSTSGSPISPGSWSSRTPTPRSSRRCARAAGCFAPRSTSTPTRTAGAAAPRCSTTRSRAGTSAPPSVRDRMLAVNEGIGWHPDHVKTRALRQVARGQRRLGALARALLGHAAAGLGVRVGRVRRAVLRRLDRRAARARRRGARRPAPAVHRRGRRATARSCGGEMRRVEEVDRRLVRLGRDAVRAVPLPVRERGGVRRALPGRLHLRGPGPDPRLVLLAARRVDPALRPLELSRTASASA